MVKTVRPESYGDIFYVGHYFREGVAVVMDLTALPNSEAVPLVDFAAGLVVGRGGFMERIAPKVFLLHPPESAEARVDLEPAPA
jgi:cell division inhibitor SepF